MDVISQFIKGFREKHNTPESSPGEGISFLLDLGLYTGDGDDFILFGLVT